MGSLGARLSRLVGLEDCGCVAVCCVDECVVGECKGHCQLLWICNREHLLTVI